MPCHAIVLLTDMVTRCRPLAAHGPRSCLSVRTQPLMATGAPSQTSTMPWHGMVWLLWYGMVWHGMVCHVCHTCHAMQHSAALELSPPCVPVPPVMSLTDMVARCRLLAAHGARSCLHVGEDPAAHGHWCTFTDLYHAMPCHVTTCEQLGVLRQSKRHRSRPCSACT